MGTQQSITHTSTSNHEYFISFQSRINGQGQRRQEILIARLIVFNQQHLNKWDQRTKKIAERGHKYMLLPKKWTVTENNYCGISETIEIQYDAFPNLFSTEMHTRKKKLTYLQEGQFWYLTNALSEVSWECHRLKQQIGNVKPSNIFMNNLGNIKVLTCFTVPTPIEPYFSSFPNCQSYLSPEELQGRRKCQMQNMTDKIKSQSFSIGMTLLSIALLHDLFHLYDYNKNELNTELLAKYLEKLDVIEYYNSMNMTFQKYSQDFKDIIKGLLQINVDKRITSLHIYNRLQPHMDSIIEMKPFQLGKILLQQQNSRNSIVPNKSVITLGSRKKRGMYAPKSIPKNIISTEPELLDESKVQRLGQSKYVGMSHILDQKKAEFGGIQFLKKLELKLQNSQKLFPS